MFFTIYSKMDHLSLTPAWMEGREVVAVFEDRADQKPTYVMWLEWRNGEISFIRDYRYVRCVVADAPVAWDTNAAL
jgi:RNA polymerase sigma-70 factor (ECF subfamily)